MAKITARGDTERARYRHPDSGEEFLLTTRGRLLHKFKGGGFKLYEDLHGYSDHGFDRAKSVAEDAGMARVEATR